MTIPADAAASAQRELDAARQRGVQVATAEERETLTAILDYLRASVVSKVAGLGEEQARRRLVPSLTTPAGLLRHLAVVERNWFRVVLQGESRDDLDLPVSSEDDSWVLPDGATVASMIDEYQRACAESRAAVAALPLDHTVPLHEVGHVSLRWILTHMIEETGRHAGHADILREQIDAGHQG